MKRRLCAIAVAIAVIAVAGRQSAIRRASGANDTGLVLFYDPDANHKAILRITSLFNEYLHEVRPDLEFQPVHSRKAFERLLKDDRAVFAIVSSSYLQEARSNALTPLAVPSSEGDVYFHKVLVDTGSGSARDLRGKRVAATATASDPAAASAAIVSALEAENVSVDGVIVIPVSKDIDALLAVSFGQADVALVTPMSLVVVSRINPGAAKSFRVRFKTRPALRPPLCAVGKRAARDERAAFAEAILTMHEHSAGNKAIRTLGFDQWLEYEDGMLK